MRKRQLFFISFVILFTGTFAQESIQVLSITDTVEKNVILDKGWKYFIGDAQEFSLKNYNDSAWRKTPKARIPTMVEIPMNELKGIGWFRLRFRLDTSLTSEHHMMQFIPIGACEVYLDGKKILTHGKVGSSLKDEVIPRNSDLDPMLITLSGDSIHTLAIRFSNWQMGQVNTTAFSNLSVAGFAIIFGNWEVMNKDGVKKGKIAGLVVGVLLGFYATLTLLHLFLFLFFRRNRSNLYYSLFTFSLFWFFLTVSISFLEVGGTSVNNLDISSFLIPLLTVSLVAFLYNQFYDKMPRFFWYYAGFAVLYTILSLFGVEWSTILAIVLFLAMAIISLIVVIKAIRRKKEGAWIIGVGVLSAFLLPILSSITALIIVLAAGFDNSMNGIVGIVLNIMMAFSLVSISLSVSVYLARQFAVTNRSLEDRIQQVQELSAMTIKQEQEKKKLLETENVRLEQQVTERTALVVRQKEELAQKGENLQEAYKAITDSISYAQNIQQALLSTEDLLRRNLGEYFVLFLPKDIVSGDFYWSAEVDGRYYLAVCDSTGHGVPGAFMSLLNMSFLKEAVIEKKIIQPNDIFDYVRKRLIESISQGNEESGGEDGSLVKDGMDGTLLCINKNDRLLTYAAANNPPVLIRNGVLVELPFDKMPIGQSYRKESFSHGQIETGKGDMLYFITDGFSDQFGGEEGKKFKYKRMVSFLESISSKNMNEQRSALLSELEAWKGNLEQVDDILVLGARF